MLDPITEVWRRAEMLEVALKDALLVFRKQIEVLRDQIDREWKNA